MICPGLPREPVLQPWLSLCSSYLLVCIGLVRFLQGCLFLVLCPTPRRRRRRVPCLLTDVTGSHASSLKFYLVNNRLGHRWLASMGDDLIKLHSTPRPANKLWEEGQNEVLMLGTMYTDVLYWDREHYMAISEWQWFYVRNYSGEDG